MIQDKLGRVFVATVLVTAAIGCGKTKPESDAGGDAANGDGGRDSGVDQSPRPDAVPDMLRDVLPDVFRDSGGEVQPTDASPSDGSPDGGATDVGPADGGAGADGPGTGGGDASATDASATDASTQTLSLLLLQTNDLHSYLQGHSPEVDFTPATTGDDATQGGMSRLAARVAAARAAAGSTPVLLLDSGDFSMGTAFEFLLTSQAAELQEMNSLHYDAITLGNHEFDWTPGGLALVLGAAAAHGFAVPIVASNLQLPASSTDLGAQAVKAAVLRKLVKTLPNGLKVGIFGLLGKNAVDVTPTVAPLTFEAIATTAASVVNELRTQDQVDVVIALSHSGIDQAGQGEDAVLAAAVPGIDVILSGHTHDALTTAVQVNDTIITQTGRYGEHLGKLALTVTKTAGVTTSVALDSYQLIPIDDSVAGDVTTQARVDGYITAIDGLLAPSFAYAEPLGTTAFDVPAGPGETAIGDLVTDAYRRLVSTVTLSQVDLAIDASGAIRTGLARGQTGVLAFDDVFRVLPLGIGPDGNPGYPLVSFYLDGVSLRSGLELSAAADVVGSDYVLQMAGVSGTYDPTQPPFQRVTSVSVGGVAVDTTSTSVCYSVTTTLYVAGLLGVVGSVSGGTRVVTPKLADCLSPVTDMNTRIVRTGTGPTAPELKAWQALVTYIGQQPPASDGGVTPAIPAEYMAPQGRFVAQAPQDAGSGD